MKGKRVFSRVLGARATTATLVGGLCLVIAGGVAFARVHTLAPKTINACANKASGALRVAGKCGVNESSYSWNTQGPKGAKGAKGPAGPAGAAGPAGPTGPSNAFAVTRAGPVNFSFSTRGSIAHLSLAAGKYAIFGKAWIYNDAGTGNSDVDCQLVASSGELDEGEVALDDKNVGPAKAGIMELTVLASLASSGGADLNCINNGGGQTYAKFIRITAIQVGSVTTTIQP
jgi:hypothetical protein